MAATYTTRLALARNSGSSWATVYTVPAGAAVVMRDILVTNLSTTVTEVNIAMALPGTGERHYLYAVPSLAASTTNHVDMRQRLMPGEALQVFCSQLCSFMFTGYVFSE